MISRVHPVANWVRLPPYEQRVALERVMRFRNMDPNPRASGVPAAAVEFFWENELPSLMKRPEVQQFARERIAELQAKSAELRQQVVRATDDLLDQVEAAQQEADRINAVLERVS